MIRLVCTKRGKHDPVTVYAYDGPLPWPDDFSPRPRGTDFALTCDPENGCDLDMRPGDERLRKLVNSLAAADVSVFDVSYWRL